MRRSVVIASGGSAARWLVGTLEGAVVGGWPAVKETNAATAAPISPTTIRRTREEVMPSLIAPNKVRGVRERPVYELDGERFDDLEGFYDELERVLKVRRWGRNLDALDEVLGERPLTLRWLHAERSRRQLGFDETVRWLAKRVPRVHASNRAGFEARLADARQHRGQTLFETVLEVIRAHGDHVSLELVD
jgi:RNAse (barnase) inhibitor barstar